MKNIVANLLKLAEVVLDKDEERELVMDLRRKLEDDIGEALAKDEPFEVYNVRWHWDKGQRGGWDDPSWDPYVDEVSYKAPEKWLIEWDDLNTHDTSDLDAAELVALYKKVLISFHQIELEDVMFDFDELGEHGCQVTITHAEPTVKGIEIKFDMSIDEDVLTEAAEKYDKKHDDPSGLD